MGTAVLAIATGGTAYAAIPHSASGVISACYRTPFGGTLRVIDTEKNQTCFPTEKRLDWNQAGVAGPPGADGSNGVSGIVKVHKTFTIQPNSSGLAEILCPGGTRPIGGGAHDGNIFDDKGLGLITRAYIAESDINLLETGWAATGVNTFNAPAEFSIDVICARA